MGKTNTLADADVGDIAVSSAALQSYVDLIDAGNARAQLILNVLTRSWHWRTGVCYPNYNTLAERAKCSRKTVQRHLAQMEKNGLIKRDTRFDTEGNGRRTSNRITLVGYEEWFKTMTVDGTVTAPKKFRNRRLSGQSVHRGAEHRTHGLRPSMDNVSIATPANVAVGLGPQMSIPSGQQLSRLEPSLEPLNGSPSPLRPRKERGPRGKMSVLAEVRRVKPDCARALDKLLQPLLTEFWLIAPDPVSAACMLAESAEKYSDAVLEDALRQLTEPGKHCRRHSAKPADIRDAIRRACTNVETREALNKRGPMLWQHTTEFEEAIAVVAMREPEWAETLRHRAYIRRADMKAYGIPQATDSVGTHTDDLGNNAPVEPGPHRCPAKGR